MKKKKLLVPALCLCTAAMLTVPSLAVFGGATVSASSLNLRDEPTESAAIIATFTQGTTMAVLEKGDEWCRVSCAGQEGYMSTAYLNVTANLTANLGAGYVSATDVNLRGEPTLDGTVLDTVTWGQSLTVNGVYGPWYFITINNRPGYIHSDYVTLGTPAAVTPVQTTAVTAAAGGQAVVTQAMQYMGTPYVWAVTSPAGFDCSGFVHYVYGQLGYTISRTAASIFQNGVAVDLSALQPGDVLCFNSFSGGNYIGHCGIYIGNNQFIHASSGAGKVVISDLTGTYSSHLAGARRIIT